MVNFLHRLTIQKSTGPHRGLPSQPCCKPIPDYENKGAHHNTRVAKALRYEKRPFRAEALELAAEREALEIRVFLAGPYININEARPRKNKKNHATILRYDLYRLLQKNDYPVSLGEYRELLEAYKLVLRDHHNAAIVEKAHAERKADAVVLLPSSPGSFTELGSFSMIKNIAEKMLILMDKKHEHSSGYVNLGASRFAHDYGATLSYCSYRDINNCFCIVEDFLEKVRDRKMRDRLAKI